MIDLQEAREQAKSLQECADDEFAYENRATGMSLRLEDAADTINELVAELELIYATEELYP